MHSFDFISEAPKNYIFKKDANKTNLGGVLFIIYTFVIIGISIWYIIDYSKNEKYQIQYIHARNSLTYSESLKLQENEKLNPTLNFSFRLTDEEDKDLSDRFLIIDYKTGYEIPRNYTIQEKVSDLQLIIMYMCEEENCTDNIEEDNKTLFNYYFDIHYTGFDLNHQTNNKPLNKNSQSEFIASYEFFFKRTLIRRLYWQNIHYKEKKGIFDLFNKEDNVEIGGYIESTYSYEGDTQIRNEYFKILSLIEMENYLDEYIEYQRTKISFLDIFANILSLSLSLFNSIALGFAFLYSKNFDNYKILEKILSNKDTENKFKNNKKRECKEIELTNSLLNEFPNENSINNAINDDNFEENDNMNKNLGKETMNSNIVLPKLRFLDFILNAFDFNKKIKTNRQNLISLCNDILAKYYSVDYILYNQIKLESLFKDYKWNDPKLEYIENNEMIKKIMNYLET